MAITKNRSWIVLLLALLLGSVAFGQDVVDNRTDESATPEIVVEDAAAVAQEFDATRTEVIKRVREAIKNSDEFGPIRKARALRSLKRKRVQIRISDEVLDHAMDSGAIAFGDDGSPEIDWDEVLRVIADLIKKFMALLALFG